MSIALDTIDRERNVVAANYFDGRARPPHSPDGDRALGRRVQVGDPVDEVAVQLGQRQRSVGPPDLFVGQPSTPTARLGGPDSSPGTAAPHNPLA
jgi:hypothetical protein